LRVAINGSEPVHATTLELFCERFGHSGFDRRAMMPTYGLAECGVGLAFPPLGRGPKVDIIDRAALRDEGLARPVDAAHAGAMHVVCCGVPLSAHELRIVDEHGAELPDRHEGRIQFRGPSTTAGYFGNPEATRALFHGDWLDSGDVGYVVDGEIHLTSRVKDLIIRGGHNIHPYDLEEATCGAVVSPCSEPPIRKAAASAWWCWRKLEPGIPAPERRCTSASHNCASRCSACRPTTSCWRRRTRC
jgi:acyl-CoA synthetase (AMP-forming)/AMP-acid ligase II